MSPDASLSSSHPARPGPRQSALAVLAEEIEILCLSVSPRLGEPARRPAEPRLGRLNHSSSLRPVRRESP